MKTAYYTSLSKIKAYRNERDMQKEFIYNNPEYLPELVTIACNVKDKTHQKALWIIELICEENITLIIPFIDKFCDVVQYFKKEFSQRPASKICMFLTNSKQIQLSQEQQNQIIEASLDWFINTDKSAIFNYCAETLLALGKNNVWVCDELRFFSQKDVPHNATPGYIYTLKYIQKRLNK